MAGSQSAKKRQREVARQEYQRSKAERREQRKAARTARSPAAPGEDPDLAGIVPGPQPIAEEPEA